MKPAITRDAVCGKASKRTELVLRSFAAANRSVALVERLDPYGQAAAGGPATIKLRNLGRPGAEIIVYTSALALVQIDRVVVAVVYPTVTRQRRRLFFLELTDGNAYYEFAVGFRILDL